MLPVCHYRIAPCFLFVISCIGIIKVRKHNGVISRLWEELCFACVGEWFADPDVVGITLSTRAKDDNIAVWNSGINGTGMNASIGEVKTKTTWIRTLDP